MDLAEREWDVIVIGAGIGGLTCAAVASAAGLKALVIERHGKLGGYAQYFGKELMFDAATWYFPGCGSGGPVDAVLGPLGLWERVERIPLDPAFRIRFPQHDVIVPPSAEGFCAAMDAAFPGQGEAIREASRVFGEIGEAVDVGDRTALVLMQHARHTAHEVFAACGVDARAQAVMGALWPFLGLPPERVDALAFGLQWRQAFLSGGVHAIRGGARAFSDALAGLVMDRGGQVVTRTPVARIRVEGGRAAGVVLDDGSVVRGRAVVSNADPYQTFGEMLERRCVDETTRARLAEWQPAISAVVMHLALPEPVQVPAQVTLVHGGYEPEAEYADALSPRPQFPAVVVGVPTLTDPARAGGRGMIMAMALASYERDDAWEVPGALRRNKAYRILPAYLGLKETMGRRLTEVLGEVLPGPTPAAVACHVATPLTLERYTFSRAGAAFGWANTPEQNLLLRPGPETCVPDLYQCGQWTYPGTGIAAVVQSGGWAAEAVVRGA